MTKEEIIKLAKEKKFVSKELCNTPYKYSIHEDMRWLFWLTEIQKWLREEHKIIVDINYADVEFWHWIVFCNHLDIPYLGTNETDDVDLTYEQALEIGIIEALKLIEDTTRVLS